MLALLAAAIQALYANAATFNDYDDRIFSINARCDDLWKNCGRAPGAKGLGHAYSGNTQGSNNDGPFINFCARFFEMATYEDTVDYMKTAEPEEQLDIVEWENSAEVFMHEMFHINAIANAPPNSEVFDLWIHILGMDEWRQAYGPLDAKMLARVSVDTGDIVMKNAENLMYFAMATRYQDEIGFYPNRPFVHTELQDSPQEDAPEDSKPAEGAFAIVNNTLQLYNQSALSVSWYALVGPAASAMEALENIITLDTVSPLFAAETDYPAAYQSNLSSWRSVWEAYTPAPTSISTTELDLAEATPPPSI